MGQSEGPTDPSTALEACWPPPRHRPIAVDGCEPTQPWHTSWRKEGGTGSEAEERPQGAGLTEGHPIPWQEEATTNRTTTRAGPLGTREPPVAPRALMGASATLVTSKATHRTTRKAITMDENVINELLARWEDDHDREALARLKSLRIDPNKVKADRSLLASQRRDAEARAIARKKRAAENERRHRNL